MAKGKAGLPDILERKVRLVGISPIMFDRYAGDNKTELEPDDKMYFLPDGKTLCLPTKNLSSFLSAVNTNSATKQFAGRGYKALCTALLGFTAISPLLIPLTRNGKPIVFNGFVNDRDEKAKISVMRNVARLPVPNPKVRPVVDLPWELEFSIKVFKNDFFDENLLKSIVVKGGLAIGLGTFRGLYGKFVVDMWE